ncbi:MAG: acyltransferase family protein, partial [Solirubrobacterales bacterium]
MATVVIFHFFPSLVPGGYIGVDVFFAISGFLITGHLIREVGRTQKVSLPGFWARRARRILPAALLVLAFTLVATLLVVPQNLWDQFLAEIRASTLYYENWYLAGQAVDYLGQDNRPSPVQHYWSLSVEEQFYIFWPWLLLGGLWL